MHCSHARIRETLLVNRGILPQGAAPASIPKFPKHAIVIRDRQETSSMFNSNIFVKSWDSISKRLQVNANEAVKIIKDDSMPEQHPLKIQTLNINSIPNRHLEYIITWYSLAILSTGMAMAFKKRKFRYR